MQETLSHIRSIQELDIKMLRLMQMKIARQNELKEIKNIHSELLTQLSTKEDDLKEISDSCTLLEEKISETRENIKKHEGHQSSIKKIDEFNALTKEISNLEKERSSYENELSSLVDQKNIEEELLEKTKQTLDLSDKNNRVLKKEIKETIGKINIEGKHLLQERNALVSSADPEILQIYEKLLKNKQDRVIVPIQDRICQGCHIALTAQHEVLVRKNENLVFCDHCSRIHYWEGDETIDHAEVKTVKRRRRKTAK